MMRKSSYRAALAGVLVLFAGAFSTAEPIVSPTWGFSIDLPEGFALSGGDGKNRFSFADASSDASIDMVAYTAGRFVSAKFLIDDTLKRLKAKAEPVEFDYRGRKAVLARMEFTAPFGKAEGWALAIELENADSASVKRPLLLMIAYGKAGASANERRYLSALDSLCPSAKDKSASGPVSVFSYPPTGKKAVELFIGSTKTTANIDASDAEASKGIIDREFGLLTTYAKSPLWKEAWVRFYRMIWRDSYERLGNVAFVVERTIASDGKNASPRALAEGVLNWVQNFKYERNLLGSDFIDLTSAATERRGDCDSRALLMAIILQRANIDALLMISREYSHAMAGVKIEGVGAKFAYGGGDWIVAETTAKVQLGMIGQNVSDPAKWIGIDFPALPPVKP
ncbi:MAG: hypothetical protein WCT14_05430 [Treponemataceae bacterium]